jgi:hypothetical protein
VDGIKKLGDNSTVNQARERCKNPSMAGFPGGRAELRDELEC